MTGPSVNNRFVIPPFPGTGRLHRKGMLSVMRRSTTNTALTPDMRSAYAERSYFMIFKHKYSLSTRLENNDMATMEKQMEVLGYLTLHTRQME